MFTVLHVEHSNFCKRLVKDLLMNSDNELKYISVKTPSEAMRLLENEKVNIIITGLEFVNDTGENFIKELNESKYNNMPIIILTANEDEEIKRKLLSLGASAYINKNASIERLKNHVSKYKNRELTKVSDLVDKL